MKNIYLVLLTALLSFGWQADAQILNQSASWPNAAWTVTGSYDTDPLAFEANPTTTPNFAFDDDDAGSGSDDSIAAESPIINLTAAHAGGETTIEVVVQYGYYYLADDILRFEYWNADTAAWVPWSGTLPGNSTTVADDFCTIPKTTFATPSLDISAFTATQLSGFRYRISYNDKLIGADWNYGFCFASPVITSTSCAAPSGFVTSNVTHNSATITWATIAGVTNFEYVLNTSAADPASGTVITANSYDASGLLPLTTYYFHIRTACTSSNSAWRTVSFTTLPTPPANDEAAGAIVLAVNADLTCTVTTSGTTIGGTTSADTAPSCSPTGINDDVWYTFTATSSVQRIVYSAVTTGTMATALYTGTPGSLTQVAGACQTGLTQNFGGLSAGTVYYARVYTTAATPATQTAFTICVSTPPPPPANDECSGAVALTVNADLNCGTVTASTTQFATQSMAAGSCGGTPDDDVWFSFVATGPSHVISLTGIAPVEGTSNDMYMQVLSGACGSLVSVQCSDPETMTVTGLTATNVYYVRVYNYYATSRNTFNICVGSFPPPPTNDNAAGAIPLTVNADLACAVTTNGTTISATASTETAPSCSATGVNDDVWYTFTATASTHRFVYSNVTTGTMATALYTGTPGSLVPVANACFTGLTQEFAGLSSGTTYYARVYTTVAAATTSTNFTVCVGTLPPAPANDDASAAIALTVNPDLACAVTTNGTTISATASTDAAPSCSATGINDDVWYTFTATETTHRFVYSNVTTGTMATALYTGTPGSLVPVANACFTGLIQDFAGLSSGTTYYARVYTTVATASTTTNFTVCVGTLPPVPANDDCASAIAVPTFPYTNTQDATSATNNAGYITSCTTNGAAMNDGVWYTVVGNGSTLTVALSNVGAWDPQLAAYSGSCGAFTCVSSADNGGSAASETITITDSMVGTTYFINVGHYSGTTNLSEGSYTIDISSAPLSTNGFDRANFSYYPNPVKDMLKISYSETITSAVVYNLLGQQLMTKSINSPDAEIDMTSLAAGTYVVKVMTIDGSTSMKIVKE